MLAKGPGVLVQNSGYGNNPEHNEPLPQRPKPMPQPDLCPACGASNQCTLADPLTRHQPCWCFTVSIDPAILQALPAELRNQSCLCPRCAQADAQLKANAPPIQ